MRLLLGATLALALLLTGCASQSGEERAEPQVTDPTTSASSPAEEPTASESRVIALVSESNVGGEVAPLAVPLDSPTAIADFGAQFTDERMGAAISAALTENPVPDGQVAMGAVVAIGCDPPTEAEIGTGRDGEVEITAAPVKSTKQCLVPVTTVALVSVDAGLV